MKNGWRDSAHFWSLKDGVIVGLYTLVTEIRQPSPVEA